MIIALDHGRRCGVAWGDPSLSCPRAGTWAVPARDGRTQWLDHARNLRRLVAQSDGPHIVIFESPFARSNRPNSEAVFRLHLGLAAIVEMTCQALSIHCYEEPSSTARKAVLGKGTFARPFRGTGHVGLFGKDKGDAKEEVRLWCESMGWQIDDDNARDAAVLWQYAKVTFSGSKAA